MAISSRHNSLTLLAAVVVAQLLLLAVQIKRERQVRLIRVWAVELISPLQRIGTWSIEKIEGGWGGYVGLRHARQENQSLQAEVDRLKLRNAELESRAHEADRLEALLSFRTSHADVPMSAATVIGVSPDSASSVIYVNRGTRDGIRRDMGVITPDGVVGKILAVYPDISQVLLLEDKDSGVGALLEASRTQGPVKGTGDPTLSMEYVSNDSKVSPGDAVVTSGEDRIFPKDLPVGTVISATTDRSSPFMKILVRPAAHLDRLEEVLILLTRQDWDLTRQADAAPASPTYPLSAAATKPGPPSAAKPAPPPAPAVKPGAAAPAPAVKSSPAAGTTAPAKPAEAGQ